MDTVAGMDPEAFVRAHTAVAASPFLPQIRLHMAADAFALWERTEEELGGGALGGGVSAPPFWAFPWAGGQALARYLLDHPAAGSGLVGIAAALAGAATVAANEIDRHAEAAIALNARLNDVKLDVLAGDLLDGDAGTEVVLAGDVFYSREMADRMIGYLDRARAAGAVVLVGDPGRAYLPRQRLIHVVEYEVPVVRALEDAAVKRVTVWRLP